MTEEISKDDNKGMLKSFNRTFWMANFFELFERGAYYGMNALLARYLTDKTGGALGFEEDDVGLLQSVVYAVTYIIPILGGALADRYGYRRMLLFAFSFLSGGYFLTGQVTGYSAVFASLLVMAVGSGLFKPIISGTIARSTNERTSGFGFGLYYWMINLGALIAPGVAGYLKGFSWSYVFTASSLYCAAMLLPTLLVFKDPPKPENTKRLREVLGGALTVLSDARFMLMIFVYSCFWILYFQNFGSVLWYLRDFIDPTPVNEGVTGFLASMGIDHQFKLDAEHVTQFNAGTIVVLQVLVTILFKKVKPLPTMVVGVLIGSTGFLFLSLSQNAWVFVAGIVIFTVGEMTAHPKYVSYIGLIAPQDKKAVYMGYAFLYGVVGSLFGSNIGGEMYHSILAPLKGDIGLESTHETIRTFWLTFAILGACTMGALLLYHVIFGKDTEKTRSLARKVMLGIYGLLIVGSISMIFFVLSAKGTVPVKTAIQSTIMMLIGIGGVITLLIRPSARAEE